MKEGQGCYTGGNKSKKTLSLGFFFGGGTGWYRGKGKLVRLQELTLGTNIVKNKVGDL